MRMLCEWQIRSATFKPNWSWSVPLPPSRCLKLFLSRSPNSEIPSSKCCGFKFQNIYTAPSLDLHQTASDTDRVATKQDRKEVRLFKELMEKHATSTNTALGVFNTLTAKSVQTDLGHILDDSRLHPRNKMFRLAQFFKDIAPPNVAIAE